jgi:hypothetical protein
MWSDDLDNRAGFRDAIQLSDKRHYVGHVLHDVTANYLIEFVVRKRIRDRRKVMHDVGVRFRICIKADRAWRFVPAATNVKDLFAWSQR